MTIMTTTIHRLACRVSVLLMVIVVVALGGTLGTAEARQKTKKEDTTQVTASTKSGEPPAPIEEAEEEMRDQEARAKESPVPYRRQFDDKQEAAVRPGDFTLDPKFRGFIPIPHTAFMVKFNPKPRVDLTLDSENTGDDFRFVPALMPLEGSPQAGGGARFNANGNGTQLRVDVRAPNVKGSPRFYYQNDFFGSDTANFRYRLQHAYGSVYGVTAGFTYGFFEDPDIWPDTLDYEGTNAVNFVRRPLIKYTALLSDSWNMTFGLEDPDFFLDTSGNPDATTQKRMPDIGFNARWEPKGVGHMQFSSIFRMVGGQGGIFPDDSDFGWGVNLGGAFDVTKKDMLMFLGNFGYGIGGLGNDTSFINSDAAYDSAGNIVALRYFSGMFGYTHKWTPRWRSTATYGYVNLQNTDLEPGDTYHFTHYASGNVVYQLFKRLSIGAEGLFGFKEVKDGRNNDVFRGQLTVAYSLFD